VYFVGHTVEVLTDFEHQVASVLFGEVKSSPAIENKKKIAFTATGLSGSRARGSGLHD
jgi:hypothetical protein